MQEPVENQEPVQAANAGCGTVVFAGGVLSLAAFLLIILPIGYLGIAIVLGGLLFLGVIAFHYFAWAKWVLRSAETGSARLAHRVAVVEAGDQKQDRS
jgi:hypothetical protein